MSLAEKLQGLKSTSRGKLPAETLAVMAQAIEDLERSGLTEKALGPGDRAPEFALEDWQGLRFNSTELLRKGPLVLSFYRGAW